MSLDKRTLKILKKIYSHPYITIREVKTLFPRNDTEDTLVWLASEHYISFRIAGDATSDRGVEMFPYDDSAHLVSIRKGDMEAEDGTLLRANIAIVVSILALLVSFLSFIFR